MKEQKTAQNEQVESRKELTVEEIEQIAGGSELKPRDVEVD